MVRGEKNEGEKRRLTIYLPVEQAKQLKIQAAINDVDMSAFISAILEKAGIGVKGEKK